MRFGAPHCANADLDVDGDVDQSDVGYVQRCLGSVSGMTGASCADGVAD